MSLPVLWAHTQRPRYPRDPEKAIGNSNKKEECPLFSLDLFYGCKLIRITTNPVRPVGAPSHAIYHEYTAALRGAALCHHRDARAKPITEKLRTNEAKLFYFEYFLEHASCCKDSADYQIESRAAKATLGKNQGRVPCNLKVFFL